MPEIGTSGSMSGDGKRSVGPLAPSYPPILDSTPFTVQTGRRMRLLLGVERPLRIPPGLTPRIGPFSNIDHLEHARQSGNRTLLGGRDVEAAGHGELNLTALVV